MVKKGLKMKYRHETYDNKGNLINVFEREYTEEEELKIVMDNRKAEYPDVGDQLDAIWKQINYDRLEGKALVQEADDVLNAILAVKAKYPKPDDKKEKLSKI